MLLIWKEYFTRAFSSPKCAIIACLNVIYTKFRYAMIAQLNKIWRVWAYAGAIAQHSRPGLNESHTSKSCLNLIHTYQYFLFFHQMTALQNFWKMLFISSKKLFPSSRYSFFFFFFIFSLPFYTFQIQKTKEKWNNLCHELACTN